MAGPAAAEPPADGSVSGTPRHELRRRVRAFGMEFELALRVLEIAGPDAGHSPAPAPRQLPPPAASDPPPEADRHGP